MPTTSERTRDWIGPALLSRGFRPFFLLGAVWGALAMAIWVLVMAGQVRLPSRFDPVSWHAHALIFGYGGCIVAGFLLTAVPNWTGRPPVAGRPLAALAALWAVGRAATLLSALLPGAVAVLIDLAFPVALGLLVGREIVAAGHRRSLPVLGLLALLGLANLLHHLDGAGGAGLRLGLATMVMLIALVGGRILPSFTRNWLAGQGSPARPAPPMQPFDIGVLILSLLALAAWVLRPLGGPTGLLLIGLGLAHCARVLRWQGHRTRREPLVWILHVGYAFLPLGALALGLAALRPDLLEPTTAQHLWMAGGIGTMTLAVMTRATLGHTGRPLTAGRGTVLVYALMLLAVAARVGADAAPGRLGPFLAAGFWIAAFLAFLAVHGPALLSRRADG